MCMFPAYHIIYFAFVNFCRKYAVLVISSLSDRREKRRRVRVVECASLLKR